MRAFYLLFHPLLWLVLVLGFFAWALRDFWYENAAHTAQGLNLAERATQLVDRVVQHTEQTLAGTLQDDAPTASEAEPVTEAMAWSAPTEGELVDEPAAVMLSAQAEVELSADAAAPETDSGSGFGSLPETPLALPVHTDELPAAAQVTHVADADEARLPPTQAYGQVEEYQDSAQLTEVAVADTEKDSAVIWYRARLAAWEGQWDDALNHYQRLIALQPGNFDAYGEMGNVYLLMGEVEQAVTAYYQAALRMSEAGYPRIAWHVQAIVARLDQDRSEQLYQALRRQQLNAAKPR